ncbi:MAG TPA: VTT domain-containing protein [Gemmatimonadales bacterium]|nr:VTT domain-containing protein [Gemmatimonadales bacterium]
MPPVPADAAALIGAFLSRRGVTSPLGVFTVVWTCNVGGALAVYFAVRGRGRRFLATKRGRRLLAPDALAVIRREYLRFGVLGIFLARFLPGIRAVVPPFAGISDIPPLRTAIPIAAHSAVWYGGITILGALLGAEWGAIVALLGGVNRALAVAAAVVVALWLALAYARARRRRRERVNGPKGTPEAGEAP